MSKIVSVVYLWFKIVAKVFRYRIALINGKMPINYPSHGEECQELAKSVGAHIVISDELTFVTYMRELHFPFAFVIPKTVRFKERLFDGPMIIVNKPAFYGGYSNRVKCGLTLIRCQPPPIPIFNFFNF